jgi:hypothetical protein
MEISRLRLKNRGIAVRSGCVGKKIRREWPSTVERRGAKYGLAEV